MHFLHRWKYLDSEHRICSRCGECQFFYNPPSGLAVHVSDGKEPEDLVNPTAFWKTCMVDQLEKHMEERRKERAEKVRKEKVSRERALELLRISESDRAFQVCKKCGARNSVEDNFCRACGAAVA